jgi:hypothetical protein
MGAPRAGPTFHGPRLALVASALVATPSSATLGTPATTCLGKPVTVVASGGVVTGTEGDDGLDKANGRAGRWDHCIAEITRSCEHP